MIQRDGSTVSLWEATENIFAPANEPKTSEVYDVIIVGAGITGLSTALRLQEAGQSCLVVEAVNIGFGTTSGTTAHLNTLLDTPYTTIASNFSKEDAKMVATAAAEALELIRRNVETYRIDCNLEQNDAYLFSQDEKEDKELGEIAEAATEAGLDLSFAGSMPFPFPFVRSIRVRGQGKFHPLRYITGLAHAFEKAGGVIMQHTRVTGIEGKDPLSVTTTGGVFQAAHLVYATHIPPGINLVHLRCAPWRSYAMAIKLDDDQYPEGLAYDMKDSYYYYRTQLIDGQRYLIAGGKDLKTGDDANEERVFRELEAHVSKFFHIHSVAYCWSSQYFEPTDGLPYIGHLPGGAPNVFVATGFGGNGMTYSGVAAICLTAMIMKQESPYLKLFSPARIKPIAGFTNFISHNTDVMVNLAGRIFPADTLPELAELAPGEGRVVKYDKQKIGVYKDEAGGIHAIDPVCTHMKCEVHWNGAETSWDCPCHGARFSIDGQVLTGPADRDLQQIRIESLHSTKK